MPDTHVLLIRCTTSPQLIDLLPPRIGDAVSANGGTLLSWYWTEGAFDMVAIVELESRFMPVLALQLEAQDGTTVAAMRAFGQQEAHDALAQWISPAAADFAPPPAESDPAMAAEGDPAMAGGDPVMAGTDGEGGHIGR